LPGPLYLEAGFSGLSYHFHSSARCPVVWNTFLRTCSPKIPRSGGLVAPARVDQRSYGMLLAISRDRRAVVAPRIQPPSNHAHLSPHAYHRRAPCWRPASGCRNRLLPSGADPCRLGRITACKLVGPSSRRARRVPASPQNSASQITAPSGRSLGVAKFKSSADTPTPVPSRKIAVAATMVRT